MTEPTERLTDSKNETPSEHDAPPQKQKTVDPRDLVYTGGLNRDPREVVENPAVTPQMLNEPGDLRDDLLEED